MTRAILIHGILLCAALVAAYFVWTREPSTSEDEIPVLNIRSGLDRVVYTAKDRTVEVTRRKDDQGSYTWVRVETVEEKPVEPPPAPPRADAGAPPAKTVDPKTADSKTAPRDGGTSKPDATAPPKTRVRKVQEFKGNKAAEELLKGLSSLPAIRALGRPEQDKLKAFGLKDSDKALTLITGATPRSFIVGGNTYGNMDVYIQDKHDGRVYVVRPRQLQSLQYAEFQLVDRDLHGFAGADVERAAIRAAKGQKILVQQNRRDPANAYWADEAAPEKRKEFYRNFMGKLLRLQALEYVAPDKKPGGLVEILAVDYGVTGRKRGFLRLYQAPAAKATPAPPGTGDKEFYAVTENTRGQVKITAALADEVARDIDALLKD